MDRKTAMQRGALEGASNRWTTKDVLTFVAFNVIILGMTMVAKMLKETVPFRGWQVHEQGGCVMFNGSRLSRRARCRQSYFVMQDVNDQLYAGSAADEVVLGCRVKEVAAWCHTLAAFGKIVVIITHGRLLVSLAGDTVVKLGISTEDGGKEK